MQPIGQNNIQPQYNASFACAGCTPCYTQQTQTVQPAQNTLPQVQNQTVPVQVQQPVAVSAQPQLQMIPPQTVQVPSNTSGVNIQIFNPTVAAPGSTGQTYNVNQPCYYPAGYYTGQMGQNGNNNVNSTDENKKTISDTNTSTDTTKKTEKKNIVQLTDQYIMNLENYLNSQDKEVRLGAAKEVYARLEEDPTRKDDKALTALINKMLQDPASEIRMIALAALDGRYVTGDDYTVGLLQNMQKNSGGYGQDGVDAANILLKMSGKQVEKEVPIDPARQKKTTKTEKTTNTTSTNKG